jgi:hypothetical protein
VYRTVRYTTRHLLLHFCPISVTRAVLEPADKGYWRFEWSKLYRVANATGMG